MNSARRELILVVDDQEENLRIVGNVLKLMGYEAQLAKGAQEAMDSLAARIPDLVLMDVLMPETDGLTACRRIKSNANWAGIPVIFLSAADDKNVIVEALESGGVDYVTKPFNMAELVSRVRTQLALKSANDRMRALAEDKDEILGILTHDMKNSLAGMRLSAWLLQKNMEALPSQCVPAVENILGATDRMLSFMTEFLANQRAEHLHLKKQIINVGKLAAGISAHHEAAAGLKRISLSVSVPKTPVFVEADKEGVTQALENLVSNAIKFTPEGGAVELIVKRPKGGQVPCIVRDTGPGFAAEDRLRMFERYGRLSARPTGNELSTGLGLSIVKRLIHAMGGTITLAETSGTGGAEFLVSLPVANSHVAPMGGESEMSSPVERRGGRGGRAAGGQEERQKD